MRNGQMIREREYWKIWYRNQNLDSFIMLKIYSTRRCQPFTRTSQEYYPGCSLFMSCHF